MLGEAIGRKKGAINKVDQDLDSFIKVVNVIFPPNLLKLDSIPPHSLKSVFLQATTFGEGGNLTTNYIIKVTLQLFSLPLVLTLDNIITKFR